jgi:large subunit ribosomal protein L17
MRHRKAGAKLGRTASHRNAMMRNMVTSLFEYDRVVTTEAKAKALKPLAEKMITLAKRGDLHARRQALSVLTKKSVTHKLFADIKDRYMDRAGGYTSIVKIGPRRGDCAEMAVLELIKPEDQDKAKKKSKKKKSPKKKEAPKAEAQAPKEEAAPAEA